MKTFTLPGTSLTVPAVVSGVMRIQDKSDAEVRALYDAARESGIDFFDHADIYGDPMFACEARFAEALRLSAAERAEITIQTKAGIVKEGPYFDFSYEHILESVDGSLAALKTDYIDILLLHRPDALVEPEEVARAFTDLEAAGKVRNFGVSNHTPGQIELLKKFVKQPLVANQLQLAPTHAGMIAQGAAMNMPAIDQSITRDLGILDYSRLHDMTVQAWSPFQAPSKKGMFLSNPEFPELNAVINDLAGSYGAAPEGIVAAWILRHPASMQVVAGTTNPDRLRAIAAGADITLTRPEWYAIYRAAGYIVP
ncbi:MAG: aldo/keto reductase [Ancrocorticia sp.]|uniref:aldo/keto reductase n=1 Tax=Ancrocorticia sp. TaxID=2593684 RepID=UPI003F90F85C